MYKCDRCETLYDLTDEHYKHISDVCDKDGICRTVIVCPGCKKERLVGGESDWDEFDNKPCIMMFGYDFLLGDVLNYKTFDGKIRCFKRHEGVKIEED